MFRELWTRCLTPLSLHHYDLIIINYHYHFWATVCKTVHPMLSDRCPVLSCPVCDIVVNGWTDQDETWYAGRPWPQPHCVRWGSSSPMERGTAAPTFEIYGCTAGFACIHIIHGPCLLWPNGWMDEDETWCGGRPQPSQIMLNVEPAPLPQRGTAPPPNFGPCLLWPNG